MKIGIAKLLLAGAFGAFGIAFASAQNRSPPMMIGQGVDPATLRLYHYTDQGTRLLPAAWMQALKMPDGSRVMDRANMERFGFISSDDGPTSLNPYGWPIGWTVSDPKTSDNVVVAGITCAACHTGELQYRDQKIRIEGGQSMADVPGFEAAVIQALAAVTNDQARKAQFFKDAIAGGYPDERMESDFNRFALGSAGMLHGEAALLALRPGPGRVDAVQGIADALLRADLKEPKNARSYNAPVSYPYLWDIWRLSWLQYNGFMPWPHAISRNIGEVLGTSGRTNFLGADGALNPEPQRWRTSVQVDNLMKMEATLKTLQAPTWPAQIFGRINAAEVARGRSLFTTNCSGCHGIKELPNGAWDVAVVKLEHIGTDPNQATNWAGRTYDGTKLGLGPSVRATAAANIINAVRNQYYADHDIPQSQREGDVTFGAACGYKARPLIGVWATPPFLHNGSVRTIYDLLSDRRPTTFGVGSRVYDPRHLGYEDDRRTDAFKFVSTTDGNSNAGHWWTDETARPGRIGRMLTEREKLAILEFLKSANYSNYPRVKVTKEQAIPCAVNPNWADARAKN